MQLVVSLPNDVNEGTGGGSNLAIIEMQVQNSVSFFLLQVYVSILENAGCRLLSRNFSIGLREDYRRLKFHRQTFASPFLDPQLTDFFSFSVLLQSA